MFDERPDIPSSHKALVRWLTRLAILSTVLYFGVPKAIANVPDYLTNLRVPHAEDLSDLAIDDSDVSLTDDESKVTFSDKIRVGLRAMKDTVIGMFSFGTPSTDTAAEDEEEDDTEEDIPEVPDHSEYLHDQKMTLAQVVALIDERDDRYANEIASAAERCRVDPDLIRTVMFLETRLKQECENPRYEYIKVGGKMKRQRVCISPTGARGFMQLMPKTAKRLGVDPNVASQNIRGGACYLRMHQVSFHRSLKLTLAAFNAGEGNVIKNGGVPPFEETQKYVRAGVKVYQALKSRRG